MQKKIPCWWKENWCNCSAAADSTINGHPPVFFPILHSNPIARTYGDVTYTMKIPIWSLWTALMYASGLLKTWHLCAHCIHPQQWWKEWSFKVFPLDLNWKRWKFMIGGAMCFVTTDYIKDGMESTRWKHLPQALLYGLLPALISKQVWVFKKGVGHLYGRNYVASMGIMPTFYWLSVINL